MRDETLIRGFVEEEILEKSCDTEESNSWKRKGKNSKLPVSMRDNPLREKYRMCSRDGKCTGLAEIDQS